ncbi:MAG: hypothetical protein LBD44_01550 [Spirochaetaceae bacterium]|jgi:hypothetical protein|nr:hypothetical protein [Spirochaetaceae bacterium]
MGFFIPTVSFILSTQQKFTKSGSVARAKTGPDGTLEAAAEAQVSAPEFPVHHALTFIF